MSSSHEFDETIGKKRDTDSGRRGAELDPALRNTVQKALGRDPGPVRLHTGPAADAEAERANADAVTRNQDIYFSRAAAGPDTESGKRLVLHEVVHALQQSGSGDAGDERSLEGEADAAAGAMMRGERGQVGLRAAQGAPQRQEKGKTETPSITRQEDEITPAPARGTISGAGVTIAYLYSAAQGALVTSITLQVPDGVSVTITPLTNLKEGDTYRVQNAGGSRSRAVVVSVDKNLRVMPKVQATFTRGSASHIVIFQFPSGGK